ncbi:period circadian protein isoform X10 [Spodoptera litura]|uniref:Period circadian protein n=1 Tax=Spodoptera litura TaxID=69820 RepID=A0A9J7IZE0_SPOLT|nr:period circadian protein isoform X10 [Spodoptera litura]
MAAILCSKDHQCNMDNLDDSENNAKISDSAYSNSCSNSQSRRSHSSKSTHSGSNSSGSSGYGGKPSTSGSSNNLGQPPKKDKEPKKKKPQIETMVPDVVVETEARAPEPAPTFDAPKEDQLDVIPSLPPAHAQSEKGVENMDICTPELNTLKDEVVSCNISQVNPASSFVTGRPLQASYCSVQSKRYQEIGRFEMRCESSEQLRCKDGFSCVISMHDGVVMYATSSLTTTLGFPKDMWIGRSFIDFVHPRDRNTFASQITNGLAVPKIVNGTQEKVQSPANSVSTMVCRIRRYRGLTTGFGVKERVVGFMPFLLKLTFKNISDEEGKVIYLVIQATPFFSAFKMPNEVVVKAVPFVIRHAANGHIEYVDPESVPYLGYLPQDLADKDALMLYHPDDLMYLRQVYDTIVKEGGLPRSKAYRMITQNGDYIRLETEWSSFINPWSKKLEFVIGKHHILEGPTNPDVFQCPEPEKSMKVPEEEKNKAQMLRETIIRTMNEALTKPAEIAKQQMSKRCQDLASFMESLMEEVPKTDEELRLEIHDPDHSYYERDSVMLGGISPHHDYYDSKSSTETPLSYNQLNYNETLQRYFDSHQPISYEDYNTVTGENILGLKDPRPIINHCLSPMAQHSGDSGEMTCSSDSNGMVMGSNSPVMPLGDYQPIRLTEALLSKHNAEMEKELMKMHRETRSSSKGDREKNSNETRKKKKEHLARCNASYHPTSAGATNTEHQQPHGVKRTSKMMDAEAGAHKHHCPSPRQARRNKRTLSTNAAVAQPSTSVTTTTVGQLATASNHWPTPPANNMNTFILGVGIPQQMSIMSPMPHPMQAMHTMPAVPGMFPMYYAPAAAPQPMPTSSAHHHIPSSSQHQFPAPMMMYSQPMYGAPFMYSPMAQQMSYPMQQSHMMAQSMQQYTNTMNPLGLTSSNYEEACKPSLTLRPGKVQGSVWRDKKRAESQGTSSKTDNGSADSNSSTNALNRVSGTQKSHSGNEKSTIYSTDIRSSNSMSAKSPINLTSSYHVSHPTKKVARRKMEPPWLEQVCVTSELVYKYQILTKSMEETLSSDKQKMKTLEQPSLVNEQLSQLYLDLQLEGAAARLTLEEGITSSSSSGEETTTVTKPASNRASTSGKSEGKRHTTSRRKREYSKLVMIYEEDAPLPPPAEDVVEGGEASSSSTC